MRSVRDRRFVVTRLDQPPLASAKAPSDVRQVCLDHGLAPIDLYDFDRSSRAVSLWAAARSAAQLLACASRLALASEVVVQYPLGRVNERVIGRLKLGRRSVCLVHDLEMLRRPALAAREISTLSKFDVVIAHSDAMAEALKAQLPSLSVVVLEAFDFLGEAPLLPSAPLPSCLYVMGNLIPDKATYLYRLDTGGSPVAVEAYGPNCDARSLPAGVRWNGVLDPHDPDLGSIKGFGLVWDGDSPSALTGAPGEYLRYNSPHKLSLYLALGMPVVVPATAAVASVVERYGLGACVESIDEGLRFIERCSPSEWERMLEAVREAQRRVRSGSFVSAAIARAGVFAPAETAAHPTTPT